jgi:hypothetical protein
MRTSTWVIGYARGKAVVILCSKHGANAAYVGNTSQAVVARKAGVHTTTNKLLVVYATNISSVRMFFKDTWAAITAEKRNDEHLTCRKERWSSSREKRRERRATRRMARISGHHADLVLDATF